MIRPPRTSPRPKTVLPRPSRSSGRYLGLAFSLALLSLSPEALAQSPPQPSPLPQTALVQVRLGLSASASERFSAPRFRRLLELELDDTARLASSMSGPLEDTVAYVWLDCPSTSLVRIEVRLGPRPVERRLLAVAGLNADVAGRLAALTTSEMIRAQAHRPKLRRASTPRSPSSSETDAPHHLIPSLVWQASVGSSWMPASELALLGSSASLGFRSASTRLFLTAQMLGGSNALGPVRWLEAGTGADYTFSFSPAWRLSLGAVGTAAVVHIGSAHSVDDLLGQQDSWSARASAQLTLTTRVQELLWLGLLLEPGAVLRPLPYQDSANQPRHLEGAWLGASLVLQFEQPLRSVL